MPEKLRGSVQPLSSFTLQEEKLCLTDVQRAPEASSCEAVNRERARRAPESSMVYYNVSMQHTEKTFEKLAHMQYDLFCRSNLIVRSMLGMGAVVLGVVNFSEWWGVLLIAYGSFLASGRYNSANHTAHKLARQIRDSGMDFPASRYVFRENAFEIIPLPENANGECLAYADVHRLGEDGEYFYIFRNQYGGSMIPKAELEEKEKEFRLFMEKQTKQTFETKAAPVLKLLRKMDTQRQKSRQS